MDVNYKKLLSDYGHEFLIEKYPDYCPYDMAEFNDLTDFDPLEAITRAFYGYRWWPGVEQAEHRESFNPNDDYFAFNGYANLISIADYDMDEYLDAHIDYDEFMEWCAEQGYIDED